MEIKSPAFQANGKIPQKYTCEGENLSPPLEIESVPGGTRSLALVMEDPDAPGGTFVHWLVWNLSPQTTSLPEGVGSEDAQALGGAVQGKNDFDTRCYGGPCPPSGEHRYHFQLFALNDALSLPPGATREELEQALQGHVLDRVSVTGRYRKGMA